MNAYRCIVLTALAMLGCSSSHRSDSLDVRDGAGAGATSGRAGADAVTGGGGSRAGDGATAGTSAGAQGGRAGSASAGRAGSMQSGSDPKAGTDAALGSRDAAVVTVDAGRDPEGAPTVSAWVGELWSITPILCRPDAPAGPVVLEPTGYAERTVLVLEEYADGTVRGRIRFGEGKVPESPGNAPYDEGSMAASYWRCTQAIPTVGFEYELRSPVRTSDRLRFDLSARDVWTPWCERQREECPDNPYEGCSGPFGSEGPLYEPPCLCDGTDCHAASQGLVAIDLAIRNNTIEGKLPAIGVLSSLAPADLRLTRVR